ncbi:hypothetical protein [Pseudomonas chlororaphis]|uniref:Uncharacterized protein n=1 Tax=Pseudomonas chlororaphis TaxID=587753 RepID=A0A1Q8EJ90_9PSED|nr:hypothetical protein [Pseudomonas chlororaphis]OLF51861.1 hypothetical protein BTN82_24260 [Pseudomonas chlororaphis]
MNLSSVIKGILLVLILFGLMACVLPARTSLVRLGDGGAWGWFLIGQNAAPAGSDYVAHAF